MELNIKIKVFLADINNLPGKMTIYSPKKTLLSFLFAEKVIILAEYCNFVINFLNKLIKVLLKYIGANKHTIELEKTGHYFRNLFTALN